MRKTQLWLMIWLVLLITASVRPVDAADLNVYFHVYIDNGITVGELTIGEAVAFQMRSRGDGTLPVLTMQRGDAKSQNIFAPDIINGMFMLRLEKQT